MKRKERTSPLRDKPLRVPGQSLDEELGRLLNDQLIILVMLPLFLWAWAGMEWLYAWSRVPRSPGTIAVMAFLITMYCGWRIAKLRRQIRSVKLGRDGERVVGQYLDELRANGARVFHDIVADDFNLDHVVVSDRGVFAIETKTWSKTGPDCRIVVKEGLLYKNGILANPNPIRQVAAEADWLGDLIRRSTGKQVAVRPVLLFPGWWVERMDRATKDVAWVLPHTALPKWLGYESSKLTADEVSMIALHIDRYVRAGRN